MTTKTFYCKLLNTKLIKEILNFQFSIFNFIKPPGNTYPQSDVRCPLTLKKYTQGLLTVVRCPLTLKKLSYSAIL